MGNLRFQILVRRQGKSVHDSDKFETESFRNQDDLKEAVNHYIDVQYEDEEDNGDMWSEVRGA